MVTLAFGGGGFTHAREIIILGVALDYARPWYG
jgi:hypothetical protein